jgi:hypothetical protein
MSTFHGSESMAAAEKRAVLIGDASVAAASSSSHSKKVKRDGGNLLDRLHHAFASEAPATPRPAPPPPEPLRTPAPTPSPYPGGSSQPKSATQQEDIYKEYSVVLEQRRDQHIARFHSDIKSTGKAVRLLQQLVDPDGKEAQADAGGQGGAAGGGNAELRKLSERLRQIRGENSELQLAIDQAKRIELVPTKSSLQQYFALSTKQPASGLTRKPTSVQRGTLGESQKSDSEPAAPSERGGSESTPLGGRPSMRLQEFDTSLEFSRSLEEADAIPMVVEERTSDSDDDDDDDDDEDEQDENGVFVYSRRKRKRYMKRYGVEKLSPERARELLQPPSMADAPTNAALKRQAATLNDREFGDAPKSQPVAVKPNPLAGEFIEEIQHWIGVCAVELEYWRTKLATNSSPSPTLMNYSSPPPGLDPEWSGLAEVMAGPFRIPLPPPLPGQDSNVQSKRQQELIRQLDMESDLSKMALLTQLWVDHTEALQQQVFQTKAQLQKMQDAHQAYCLGVGGAPQKGKDREQKKQQPKDRHRNNRLGLDTDESGSADDEDPIVVPRPSVIDDGGFFLPVVIPHAMPEGEDQWRHWRDQLLLESQSRGEPEVREEWVLELISRLDNQIRETIVHILATCTI